MAVDELCRGQAGVTGQERPAVVVQVEHGLHGDEIHVGLVEGIDGAHVAPVVRVALGGAGDRVEGEVVDAAVAGRDEGGNDVSAHVVLGIVVLGILGQGLVQRIGIEHVVAHGGKELIRCIGQAELARILRLLDEAGHLGRVTLVNVDDAELRSKFQRLANAGDRQVTPGGNVLLDHLREVHAVDVVRTRHQNDVRTFVVQHVEGLVDGVRGPEVPVLAASLLGGNGSHVVAEQVGHLPGLGDVAIKGVRLVLGQHDDLQISGIDDIAQRVIDEAVDATKWNGRLCAIFGERHQPLAFASGQDDGKDSWV